VYCRWWKEGSESTISTGPQLNIGSAKVSSEGRYFCQPSNAIGLGTTTSAELRVYQAPRIIQTLQPQIIRKAGDSNFKVSCAATAKPKPTITWAKDGQILDPSSPLALGLYRVETHDVDAKNGAYTVNSTLFFSGSHRHLDQILAEDRGYYACGVENEVRKEESHMYLRVQHKPLFIPQRKHEVDRVAFDVGETAYIPCKVQSFPKPEFQWSYNGAMLNFDARHTRPYEFNISILANDIYVVTLVVQGIQSDDYGQYTCQAMNSMGNSSSGVVLQQKGKPSPPNHLRAVDNDVHSVLIGWDPGFNGGYDDTKYIVQYFSDDDTIKEATCLENPCNITGLREHTSYNFRVSSIRYFYTDC
jgi:echinoid protein